MTNIRLVVAYRALTTVIARNQSFTTGREGGGKLAHRSYRSWGGEPKGAFVSRRECGGLVSRNLVPNDHYRNQPFVCDTDFLPLLVNAVAQVGRFTE